MDNGGSGNAGDLFDWDSVAPEPGERHGLPDWYPRAADDPGGAADLLEPTPEKRPWWSRSVSLRDLWHVLGLVVVVAFGLTKLVTFLVIAHVDLAAAHAGIATDVLAYGVVLLFSGFMMRWTSWGFGLGQVLRPDLYDDIGWWLLRLGTALGLIGSLAVIAIEYL